jgi:peroxiredoxin Q/BCP
MTDTLLGKRAPAIDLPTDAGDRFVLSSHKGHPVVVYFYPKDDTSGCTTQAREFSRLIGDFRRLGVAVVGISPDPVASKARFRKKHDLLVELAADEDKAVCGSYGVWVEKSMYGRKYMGVDRSTFLIDAKGKVAGVWRKVKVPGHAEEVLAAAREIKG